MLSALHKPAPSQIDADLVVIHAEITEFHCIEGSDFCPQTDAVVVNQFFAFYVHSNRFWELGLWP